MARLQGLSPGDARRFRSGRACLDFAHTGGDGPLAAFELLHDLDDVQRWIAVVLDLDGVTRDVTELAEVLALRRAIWTAASSIAAGQRPRAVDRTRINEAAAEPPIIPQLLQSCVAAVTPPVTIGQALSSLARDAIELFGGPLASRVRVCAAADCGLLFVDQSRPGRRRWCSMQRCGNLQKLRTYRTRGDRRRYRATSDE